MTYAFTCPRCGWDLTIEALRDNDGIPYCCGTMERES